MTSLTICSWNVNGLRATLKGGFLQDWLATTAPDIVGMQEVKATAAQVEDAWSALGYSAEWHTAEKAGYSGAVLLSKVAPLSVRAGLGIPEIDAEGRLIEADFPGFTLLTSYFPNAGRGVERMAYKHQYFEAFLARCDALRAEGKSVIFMGDLNVAHHEVDVARPEEAIKGTGFLLEERVWIDRIIEHGYVDTFRALNPAARDAYSYWDAWRERRARNIGWRIDYVFVSADLMPRVRRAFIQPEVMGSDHCPVGIELELPG